jgi:hypothetical protein
MILAQIEHPPRRAVRATRSSRADSSRARAPSRRRRARRSSAASSTGGRCCRPTSQSMPALRSRWPVERGDRALCRWCR